MKIFHIVSNKEWGGGEQYVYDLCQRQKADGIDVQVFCKPIGSIASKFEEAGIKVKLLPLGGALDAKSAWRMATVVKKAGPCVIHAHNFKDAFTAAYARKLAIANKQIRGVVCRHLVRKGKNSWLYRWLYGQLDCLCFNSHVSEDMFLSTHPAIDNNKLCIVHTSIVVPAQLQPVDIRQEFSLPTDCVIVMYHGRLDPEKGIDTLLEAVDILHDKTFRLILVGRGSEAYTAHLNAIVAEKRLQDKVILAGFRNPVLPYVASCDVGVLPSVVPEGCSLSAQEHMSQGHPIIATNNGGQREYIISGSNGLLVPPGDAQALAAAMGQLIDDDDLRRRMGQKAQADFYDHLSYENFYKKISTIYAL